jgi:hypothetical protein
VTTTTIVKERVEGHYEVLEEPYGKVYKWVSAYALIECDCGQLFSTEGTTASCPRCEGDYTGVVRGVGGKPLKEDDTYTTHAQREYQEWMKGEENHLSHSKRLYSWGLFSGLTAKDEINRILDVLYGS